METAFSKVGGRPPSAPLPYLNDGLIWRDVGAVYSFINSTEMVYNDLVKRPLWLSALFWERRETLHCHLNSMQPQCALTD
jgi:hypothetical protein